jgi:hypothetical protein
MHIWIQRPRCRRLKTVSRITRSGAEVAILVTGSGTPEAGTVHAMIRSGRLGTRQRASTGGHRSEARPTGITRICRIAGVAQAHTHAQLGIFHRGLDGHDDRRTRLRQSVISEPKYALRNSRSAGRTGEPRSACSVGTNQVATAAFVPPGFAAREARAGLIGHFSSLGRGFMPTKSRMRRNGTTGLN